MKCSQADNLLNAYLDGELSEVERSAVDEHMRRCAACAAALHGLKGTVALVSSLPRRPAPAGFASAVQRRVEEEAESARTRAVRPGVRRHRLVLAFAQRAAAAVVMLLVGFAGYVALRPETATEGPDLARRFEVGKPAVATGFASEDAREGGAAGWGADRGGTAPAGPAGTSFQRAAAKPEFAGASALAVRDKAHDSYGFTDGLDQTLQVSRASIRSNDVPTAVRTVRTILATNGWLAGEEAGRDEGGDGKVAEPEAPVKISAVVPEAEMLALQNALTSREDLWTVNFDFGHKRRVRAPAEEPGSVVRLAKAVDVEGRAEAGRAREDGVRGRKADGRAGEVLKERAVESSAGSRAGRSQAVAQEPTARETGVTASAVPAADRLDEPSDADDVEAVKAAPKPEVERTGRVMDELARRSAGEAEARDALAPATTDLQKKETAAPPSPSCRPVATVPPAAGKAGTPDDSAAINGRSVPKTKSPAVEHKAALADVTTTGEDLLRKHRQAEPSAPRRGLANGPALTTRPTEKHAAAARPEQSPSPPAPGGERSKVVPEGPGRPAGQSGGGASGKAKKDVSPCEARLAAAEKPTAGKTAQHGRHWRAPTSRPAATAVEGLHSRAPTSARTRGRLGSGPRSPAGRPPSAPGRPNVYHVTIVIEPQRPADPSAARQ